MAWHPLARHGRAGVATRPDAPDLLSRGSPGPPICCTYGSLVSRLADSFDKALFPLAAASAPHFRESGMLAPHTGRILQTAQGKAVEVARLAKHLLSFVTMLIFSHCVYAFGFLC